MRAEDSQPEPFTLMSRIGLERPPVGFYDAPDPRPFAPLEVPEWGDCVFAFYRHWLAGRTLHLTPEHSGCPGASWCFWGVASCPKGRLIRHLVDQEGLKASYALMRKCVEASKGYQAVHRHLLLGPLRRNQWKHLKTVVFFVEPDQLSALVLGAHYHSAPEDVPPVIVPSGSGCMSLVAFERLEVAQAAIGATEIGIRHFLPSHLLAFIVTKSMYQRLCALDERSLLYKADLQRLLESRRRTPKRAPSRARTAKAKPVRGFRT